MHWLESSREEFRRVSSEGSLLLTVVVSLNSNPIRRGGGGGVEHERMGKGGGGGPGRFSRQDIRRRSGGIDFKGGGWWCYIPGAEARETLCTIPMDC